MIGLVLNGRYELAGLLNESPVFAAYSARDRQTGRDVSIRILQPAFRNPQLHLALAKAIKGQKNIHASAVETISLFEQDGEYSYMVADLTRSPTLADRIKKLAPFSIAVAVSTAISICRAADLIHQSQVVHGDLNPANILVMGDGEIRLQLAGIWEAYAASATAGLSVLPSMAPYLAPEVTKGGMPSVQSDVYAIGVLLYELLTGRQPYRADSAIALTAEHCNTPTPSVRTLNQSVPLVLDEIVKKAMAKDPAERYQSASAMMTDLRILQDGIRFGKTLSWPLPGSGAIKPTAPKIGQRVVSTKGPQPVAPRMSALRTDHDAEEARRRAREDRDVPIWMMVVASVLFGALLVTIGAYVMLNLSKPKLITVPNVREMTLAEARKVLQPLKLDLRVKMRQINEKVEQDRILDMDPVAGSKVHEGERIKVVVSSGTRMVVVPDLTGQTVDKTKQLLSGLNLEPIIQVAGGGEPSPESEVIRTEPSARTKVERFSRVKVLVGEKGAATPVAPPTDEGMVSYTYQFMLENIDQETTVKIDMTDDLGTKTVYDQKKQPGEEVVVNTRGKGAKVTFQIYFDGKLVKSETKEADR